MSLSVTCEWCESSFSVSERHAGKQTPCPNCGETISIPRLRSSREFDRDESARPGPRRREPDRRSPERRPASAARRDARVPGANLEKKSFLVGLGVAGGAGLLLLLVVGIGLAAFYWGRSDASRDTESDRPASGVRSGLAATNPSGTVRGSNAGATAMPAAVPTSTSFPANSVPAAAPAANPASAPVAAPVAPASAAPKNLADLIEEVEKSVVRIDVRYRDGEGNGSGFVVGKDGTILTNEHVMEDAVSATVHFSDGGQAPVEGTLLVEPRLDIAVVRIAYPAERLVPLPLAPTVPRKGEQVVACGAPYGLSFTATEGIVSAVRSREELRELGIPKDGTWIQTTTPISPGNSGGPLLNLKGEVVGMNTMTLSRGQNLNFSISMTDMQGALARKSATVTRLAPAAPVRPPIAIGRSTLPGSSIPYVPSIPSLPRTRNVDSRTTDEGRRLFAGISEMALLSSTTYTFDTSNKVRDYVREMARKNADMSEIQLNNSLKAMMFLSMRLSSSATSSGAQRLEMSGYVLVRTNDAGVETIHKVWEYSEDMGTIHRNSIAKGEIPDNVRRKVVAFFQKFRDDRGEAKKTAPPAAKKTAAGRI